MRCPGNYGSGSTKLNSPGIDPLRAFAPSRETFRRQQLHKKASKKTSKKSIQKKHPKKPSKKEGTFPKGHFQKDISKRTFPTRTFPREGHFQDRDLGACVSMNIGSPRLLMATLLYSARFGPTIKHPKIKHGRQDRDLGAGGWVVWVVVSRGV